MGERRSRLRILGIVLAGLAVLAVGGALALRAAFTPGRLRATVVRAGESALGLPVDVASAKLTLLPLGIDLRGVRVAGAAPQDTPLLDLESGRARLALAPLLRGRIVVSELHFERPSVALRRDGAGVVLPGTLGAQPPAGRSATAPSTSTPPTSIERLEIVDGTLILAGPDPPGDVTIRGIDLAARVDLSESGTRVRSKGELRLAKLSIAALNAYRETLDTLSPSVQFDVDYSAKEGTLAMESLHLVAGPLDMGAKGRITGLPDHPRISLAVEPTTLSLEELLPLVPPALIPDGRRPQAKGEVKLAVQVDGPLGDPATPPSFRAELEFAGAELGMEGFEIALKNLRGGVVIADTSLVLRALEASLGDGSLRLDGRVAGPHAPDSGRVDLAVVCALDLGLVQQAGLVAEGTTLGGRLDADVKLQGRTAAPTEADLHGTVTLAKGHVTMPTLPVPVTDLEAQLVLEGPDAVLRTASGKLGSSTFRGEGRIRNVLGKSPVITLRGSCPRLDLVELAPPPPTAAAAPSPAAPGSGTAPPLSPALVPELPPFTADLELAVDSLIAVNTGLANATLTAHLSEGKARLQTRVARAHFGPDVTLHDVSGNGEIANGRLDATFTAPRADAFRMPLTAIDGRVGVEGHRITMSDMRAACFTGRIEGDALVDLADPKAPSFEIDSRAAGLEANDFVSALTPARDVLHGSLDVASKFSGRGIDPKAIAASLVANGTVDAHGGRLARGPWTKAVWNALNLGEQEAIQFKEMTAPFSIQGGKLVTENLVIESPEAKWHANGSLAFDGMLDYGIEVELGEALGADFRKRAGADVARLLASSSGRVTLDLRVTGPAARPQVTLDTAKLAQRAASHLGDEARDKLDSAKDRLMDQLGLGTARRDSTSPGDSAAPDSAQAPPTIEDALKGLLGGKRK